MKRAAVVAGLTLLLGACADGETPLGPVAAAAPDAPLMTTGVERGASVLLVHGYDPSGGGQNCVGYWDNQKLGLQALGHTGRRLTVGYYSNNSGCERNLSSTVYTKNFAGDWTLERGTANGQTNVLTNGTPIEHVAYRFAWLAAKENNDNLGASVRVIAHSLGGLVVRHAIQQASLGNPNFPTLAQMNITRVITYGTPHTGTSYAWGSFTEQGLQMRPGSGFLNSLNGTPRVGSATWIGFTSLFTFTGDGVVDNGSACWSKMTWCGRHYGAVAGFGLAARGAYWHNDFMGDSNFTYALSSWDVRNPSVNGAWGTRFNDIGAPGMAARNLASF